MSCFQDVCCFKSQNVSDPISLTLFISILGGAQWQISEVNIDHPTKYFPFFFGSPEQSSWRAILLPSMLALAVAASTNVKVFLLKFFRPYYFITLSLIWLGYEIIRFDFSGERMCTILVNRLEDQACPVNVWLGKLTALDMTPLGWLGRKTSTQTNTDLIYLWYDTYWSKILHSIIPPPQVMSSQGHRLRNFMLKFYKVSRTSLSTSTEG